MYKTSIKASVTIPTWKVKEPTELTLLALVPCLMETWPTPLSYFCAEKVI